jgi:DNA-binding NtrC family response regulator
MSNATILIADDEEYIRNFMQKLFVSLGYNVVLAHDGDEAMRQFTAHHIDCVISDINMPKMDGFEFLNQIRQRDSKVPFFLMSGHYKAEEVPSTIMEDVSAIISKPFDVHEILDKVLRALPFELSYRDSAERGNGEKTFVDKTDRRSGRDKRDGRDRRSGRNRRDRDRRKNNDRRERRTLCSEGNVLSKLST